MVRFVLMCGEASAAAPGRKGSFLAATLRPSLGAASRAGPFSGRGRPRAPSRPRDGHHRPLARRAPRDVRLDWPPGRRRSRSAPRRRDERRRACRPGASSTARRSRRPATHREERDVAARRSSDVAQRLVDEARLLDPELHRRRRSGRASRTRRRSGPGTAPGATSPAASPPRHASPTRHGAPAVAAVLPVGLDVDALPAALLERRRARLRRACTPRGRGRRRRRGGAFGGRLPQGRAPGTASRDPPPGAGLAPPAP